MPRTKLCMPTLQRELEDELRARYGGMMTLKNICDELGAQHHLTAERFMSEVTPFKVNGRKRWRVCDVAKRFYECHEHGKDWL